jgi:hypothetical protein
VISEPFAYKTRREAEALGMGDVPLLVLPHPIGQLAIDQARALFELGFEEVDFILTAPAPEVASAYRDQVEARTVIRPDAGTGQSSAKADSIR